MKFIKQNNQGFSIVVAIFMIGFLLVLTTGVFNLVLREMKGNKGAENYLKAYAGAEGAMELGLLNIKKNGYGFDKDLNFTDSGSEVLSFETDFKKKRDPKISYTMDIKTNIYKGSGSLSLGTGSTVIVPLFWNDGTSQGSTKQLELSVIGKEEDMYWNIVGDGEGISGTGSFSYTDSVEYRTQSGSYIEHFHNVTIEKFLGYDGTPSGADNSKSYLMLFNKSSSDNLDYILKSKGGDFFSKPVGTIVSSVVVGKYKQNISTQIDNTEFLNMLKYSVYSK